MHTDACNVEDMNIFHIKECLLLSCVASFEDWSCIFPLVYSPCARMILISTKGLILRRCQGPYHRHQQ